MSAVVPGTHQGGSLTPFDRKAHPGYAALSELATPWLKLCRIYEAQMPDGQGWFYQVVLAETHGPGEWLLNDRPLTEMPDIETIRLLLVDAKQVDAAVEHRWGFPEYAANIDGCNEWSWNFPTESMRDRALTEWLMQERRISPGFTPEIVTFKIEAANDAADNLGDDDDEEGEGDEGGTEERQTDEKFHDCVAWLADHGPKSAQNSLRPIGKAHSPRQVSCAVYDCLSPVGKHLGYCVRQMLPPQYPGAAPSEVALHQRLLTAVPDVRCVDALIERQAVDALPVEQALRGIYTYRAQIPGEVEPRSYYDIETRGAALTHYAMALADDAGKAGYSLDEFGADVIRVWEEDSAGVSVGSLTYSALNWLEAMSEREAQEVAAQAEADRSQSERTARPSAG